MHINATNKFDFYCFKNFTIPPAKHFGFWLVLLRDEVWGREMMFSQLAKRVTFRGGQRIIKVVFIVVLEARSGKLDGLSLSQSENKGLDEVLSLAGP